MTKSIKFIGAILLVLMICSCNVDGDSTSEIKLFPVKIGNEFQYIDRYGQIIIKPQFEDATVFREGMALVLTSGEERKFGFINIDGKYAINPQFKAATVFGGGLAWVVTDNSAPSAIDYNGEIKFTLQQAEEVRFFKNKLAAFSILDEKGKEKWGFVDNSGNIVIKPQFTYVSNFSDGKCAVKNENEKWGFIDKEGRVIINYQFDNVGDFINGRCVVVLENKNGVIDKNGKYIINPQYAEIGIDGDFFLVNQDGKYGWIDKNGKLKITPQFDAAYRFDNNKLAPIRLEKNFGYINDDGIIVINPQFYWASPFNGKLAIVSIGRKLGFIDKMGNYAINPQFDNISGDLISYLFYGDSEYKLVKTDYFNAKAISTILNFDSPEGFSINTNFNDIIKKHDLKEWNFNYNNMEHKIFNNKKINNDLTYSFFAIGPVHDKIIVTKGSGWYTYEEIDNKFNGEKKPTGYKYVIELQGKGNGKEEILVSEIVGKLDGYIKNEEKSNYNTYIYSNGQKEIRLVKKFGEISVIITRNIIDPEGLYEYEASN